MEESDYSFEKVFTKSINDSSFTEYLAPVWNEENDESEKQISSFDVDDEKSTAESDYVIYDEKSQSYITIIELVSNELEAYVHRYISALVDSFSVYLQRKGEGNELNGLVMEDLDTAKLQNLVSEAIRSDSLKNSHYCKKLIKWLSTKSLGSRHIDDDSSFQRGEYASAGPELSNQISGLNEVCDEYMKYAPGPWRECILIEAFKGRFLPELQSTILKQLTQAVSTPRSHDGNSSQSKVLHPSFASPDDKNKSEATENEEVSLSVSEGDDFSDSVSSIGGDRVFDQSFDQTISVSIHSDSSVKQMRGRNKRLMMMGAGGGNNRHTLLNKYKTQIYVLQNQLAEAEAHDKTILQERLREYRLDMDSLRRRNKELREQLSDANMKFFEMMITTKKNSFRKLSGSTVNPSVHSRAISSGVDDNGGSDDDEFQDAVPNVEDAYAINKQKKKQYNESRYQEKGFDDNSYGSHQITADMDAAEENFDREVQLLETLSLYEKQFDAMKNEIHHLHIIERKLNSGRGSHQVWNEESASSGGTYASLNSKSLREVNTDDKRLPGDGKPIFGSISNHTVSFNNSIDSQEFQEGDETYSVSLKQDNDTTKYNNNDERSRANSTNSFDNTSQDGIWKVVSDLDTKPTANFSEQEKHNSLANFHSVSEIASSTKPPLPNSDGRISFLSAQQKRYIEKMIQRGIDAGKDIDKKTITSLSEEIKLLSNKLHEKEVILSTMSSAPLQTSESDNKNEMVLKLRREIQRLQTSLDKIKNSKQHYSTYQAHLLYSFLFGGAIILVISSIASSLFGL